MHTLHDVVRLAETGIQLCRGEAFALLRRNDYKGLENCPWAFVNKRIRKS